MSGTGESTSARSLWAYVLDRAAIIALAAFSVMTLLVFFILPSVSTHAAYVGFFVWVALLIALIVPMRTLIGEDGLEIRHAFHPRGKFIPYERVRFILDNKRGMDVVLPSETIAWRTVEILSGAIVHSRADLRERFARWQTVCHQELPKQILTVGPPYPTAVVDEKTLRQVLAAPHAPLPLRIEAARVLVSADIGNRQDVRAAAAASASHVTRTQLLGVVRVVVSA